MVHCVRDRTCSETGGKCERTQDYYGRGFGCVAGNRFYYSDVLHVYVQPELAEFHRAVVEPGETVREEQTALLAAMMPAAD